MTKSAKPKPLSYPPKDITKLDDLAENLMPELAEMIDVSHQLHKQIDPTTKQFAGDLMAGRIVRSMGTMCVANLAVVLTLVEALLEAHRDHDHSDIVDDPKNIELARQLDAYIAYRARKENVGYDLSPEFFSKHLDLGAVEIFGVVIQDGKLVEDKQQPQVFAEWLAQKHLN
jgi:hypothetical protein